MHTILLYKRLLSYIYPVFIRHAHSGVNPILELYLFRGQLQLATLDALYSDGNRYKPLWLALSRIKRKLPLVKNVLVLGTGLGSAVKIMNRLGHHPHFTLVDNDEIVLQWALEFAEQGMADKITPRCVDAKEFIDGDTNSYEILIIDVFKGRDVPAFVTQPGFIQKCRWRIRPGGNLIFNYIVSDTDDWAKLKACIDNIFPDNEVIHLGINRIIIATV